MIQADSVRKEAVESSAKLKTRRKGDVLLVEDPTRGVNRIGVWGEL